MNIFEAKPERAVRFDEVLAAVVPDGTDAALLDGLREQGVGNILTYENDNDADRLEKVNSVEGSRFSLKETQDVEREESRKQDAVLAEKAEKRYNKLSDAAKSILRRIDAGERISVDELMQLPEVRQALEEGRATPTIDLPDREGIRDRAYQKAMKKGSYSGKGVAGRDVFNGPVRRGRRVDIVIGLPGSGKSSVYTNRISQKFGSRIIDTDDYREYIPEYTGRNAAVVHEEASLVKKLVQKDAVRRGENIILSTIGQDMRKLRNQVRDFNDKGYSVYLHLNELPNGKALMRAARRFLAEGRYVPRG